MGLTLVVPCRGDNDLESVVSREISLMSGMLSPLLNVPFLRALRCAFDVTGPWIALPPEIVPVIFSVLCA